MNCLVDSEFVAIALQSGRAKVSDSPAWAGPFHVMRMPLRGEVVYLALDAL